MNLKNLVETGVNLGKVFPNEVVLFNDSVILTKSPFEVSEFTKYPRGSLYEAGWPPNPGTFEIKDAASPVAVVCPRQDLELQQAALFYGAAISGPCITPDRGVELVVSNIIANPNIRWMILAGKDSGHLAGDVLYCLWKYGIDPETHRVRETRCPTNPYLFNLRDEAIERFRKQVKIINVLGAKNKDQIELGLLIRCCLQWPQEAIFYENHKFGDGFHLCDIGSENQEPMLVDLSVQRGRGYFEGYGRVGTTIHAFSVADSYPMLESHILTNGSWGMQESSKRALDVVGTQIVIYDVDNDLCPSDWRPFGWMQTDEGVHDYLEKYRLWVYLFPLTDVRFTPEEGCVPYLVEEGFDYLYGTRLTTHGIEWASQEEQSAVIRLVCEFHDRFKYRLPEFADILEFHKRLDDIQRETTNQLYKTAQATRLCVEEEIGASYRLYMTTQIPAWDIDIDPREAHNPCFALYEVYPRKINGKWQLDCAMFLRANDYLAFPANANGGIVIQKFLAWYAGIKPGLYLHHTGCLHICDYMLPRELVKKLKEEKG